MSGILKSAMSLLVFIFSCAAFASSPEGNHSATRILFTSDSMVYVVDPAKATTGFSSGVVWQLCAKDWPAASLGVRRDRLDHIDECKPIAGGSRLMLTSSYGWAAVVDTLTSSPVFFTAGCNNAHSIDMIADSLIAVACSRNGDQIRLYANTMPPRLLDTISMPLAHGVVWMDKFRKLYAIGDDMMCVFEIDGDHRFKRLDTIALPAGHSHDLSAIDADRLLVSGRSSFIYDIGSGSWTELPLFANSKRVKSVNYNPCTQELWYTDATDTTSPVRWRSDKLSHAASPDAEGADRTIGLDGRTAYKVRVIHW